MVTIRSLHIEALKRFPRGEVHSILHDAAEVAFGVGSLKQCDQAQLAHLMSSVCAHPYRPRKSGRPRRGRPARDGVVKLATPRQRDFINTLASELAWSQSILDRWLKRFFNADNVGKLATSADAHRAINWLKSIKTDKQSRAAGRGEPVREH